MTANGGDRPRARSCSTRPSRRTPPARGAATPARRQLQARPRPGSTCDDAANHERSCSIDGVNLNAPRVERRGRRRHRDGDVRSTTNPPSPRRRRSTRDTSASRRSAARTSTSPAPSPPSFDGVLPTVGAPLEVARHAAATAAPSAASSCPPTAWRASSRTPENRPCAPLRLPSAVAPPAFAARRGYTAVEVLMAMTVMAIGAAAVMTMQKTSVQGNLDARKTDIANSIARTWVERLQRDAMQWTLPEHRLSHARTTSRNAQLLSSTHVRARGSCPRTYMGTSNPETMSYALRHPRARPAARRDVSARTEAVFCVNYRLQWLVPQALPTRAGAHPGRRARALAARHQQRARPRGLVHARRLPRSVNPDPASRPRYHTLYLTTDIRAGRPSSERRQSHRSHSRRPRRPASR